MHPSTRGVHLDQPRSQLLRCAHALIGWPERYVVCGAQTASLPSVHAVVRSDQQHALTSTDLLPVLVSSSGRESADTACGISSRNSIIPWQE
jgi:hypothetical protein